MIYTNSKTLHIDTIVSSGVVRIKCLNCTNSNLHAVTMAVFAFGVNVIVAPPPFNLSQGASADRLLLYTSPSNCSGTVVVSALDSQGDIIVIDSPLIFSQCHIADLDSEFFNRLIPMVPFHETFDLPASEPIATQNAIGSFATFIDSKVAYTQSPFAIISWDTKACRITLYAESELALNAIQDRFSRISAWFAKSSAALFFELALHIQEVRNVIDVEYKCHTALQHIQKIRTLLAKLAMPATPISLLLDQIVLILKDHYTVADLPASSKNVLESTLDEMERTLMTI